MSSTISSLHPFYEFGGVISLTTFFIRNQTILRLALLSAHIFYIVDVTAEKGTIDFECVVWNVINLSFNFYMLVGLMRKRMALRSPAEHRRSLAHIRDLTLTSLLEVVTSYVRLRVGEKVALTRRSPSSDKLFF